MPPEVGESNHIDVQPSMEGGQSDKAMQPVNHSNLIILPPRPPHIPSPTVVMDLHTEYGIEKQQNLLNNDLCTAHDDCNAGELNVPDAARHSNEKSTAASIGAHSIANNCRSQSVNVPSSDSLSDSVVVTNFTPVTMCRNCIFDNKKLLQYHIHYDVMSKHYQFKVKRSNSTLLHVICIDNEGCPWASSSSQELDDWGRGKEAILTSLRGDDAESYKVIVVDGSALKVRFGGMLLAACGQVKNGSIFPLVFAIVPSESKESCKWFFEKLRDSIGTRESLAIVADRHKGIEYAVNLVYKDFKGPLKIYFDGASMSYLLSEHQHHMESIRSCNPDMHRYLVQADPTKWSRAYFNGRRYAIMTTNIAESLNSVDRKARLIPVGFMVEWLRELQQRWFVERREEVLKITSKLAPKAEKLIRTNFSLGLTVTPRPDDQFEYAVTNNAAQIWIVDMSERTCTCRRFQVDQIPCPHTMAVFHPIDSAEGWNVSEEVRLQIVNPPNTKRGSGWPRVRRILSQGEEYEPIRCGRCNDYGHNR
ncbi:hypothetical protein TIFTF001_033921 [Ficus carica]|uniref:SWIM-type domain-containing protein n=1 Tax=Ficus carica TaxID=3494 RepID=A0AA88E082_FICCA|nr:hypothetical protein TIFTF001_033921 [Ficus carica]